jgi:homoserine dehydrogenase
LIEETKKTMVNSLKIGLFGAGVVGGGVYELIQKYTQRATAGALPDIEIVKICWKNIEKQRDFQIDLAKTQVVSDFNEILHDPSINCIVEVIGGIDTAKLIVFEAIKQGKHVITANKALIATFLPELQAELAAHPNVQ